MLDAGPNRLDVSMRVELDTVDTGRSKSKQGQVFSPPYHNNA